jgi:hypothetical protein
MFALLATQHNGMFIHHFSVLINTSLVSVGKPEYRETMH